MNLHFASLTNWVSEFCLVNWEKLLGVFSLDLLEPILDIFNALKQSIVDAPKHLQIVLNIFAKLFVAFAGLYPWWFLWTRYNLESVCCLHDSSNVARQDEYSKFRMLNILSTKTLLLLTFPSADVMPIKRAPHAGDVHWNGQDRIVWGSNLLVLFHFQWTSWSILNPPCTFVNHNSCEFVTFSNLSTTQMFISTNT